MTEALITGIIAVVVCMINNIYQQKRTKVANEKTIDLIDYKLSELTKRVDKHNNLIERTYRLEEAVSLQEEKIKAASNRMYELDKERR